MFLRIETFDKEGKEQIEVMYECKSYRRISDRDGMVFILDDNDHIKIDREKRRTIYIMNSQGKTIDKICWMHK